MKWQSMNGRYSGEELASMQKDAMERVREMQRRADETLRRSNADFAPPPPKAEVNKSRRPLLRFHHENRLLLHPTQANWEISSQRQALTKTASSFWHCCLSCTTTAQTSCFCWRCSIYFCETSAKTEVFFFSANHRACFWI